MGTATRLEGGALRILFAGTPEPAVTSLKTLLRSDHEVLAVVTRPPARAGRGRTLQPSPVAVVAHAAGIQVLTPASAKDPSFADQLAGYEPDAGAVVAYGAMLPQPVLDIPRLGWVNLHFSLLPAWRGAAPVFAAIKHGDDVTGASTFRLEAGMDTGPVYGAVTETIRPDDTTGALLARLASSGGRLLLATLDGIADGTLHPVSQPVDGVSHAAKVTGDDSAVNWNSPAVAIDRLVRALTPDPGARTSFRGTGLGLGPVSRTGLPAGELAPGELRVERSGVLAGTATAPVRLGEVQPSGKRSMSASDWARGSRPQQGERFGGER